MNTLFKNLKKVALTEEERLEGLRNLHTFLANNPVRENSVDRLPYQRSRLNLLAIWENSKMKTKFAFSMIGILLAGSGVSYAAEGALPGDVLYPVKVNVNENMRAAVSLSAESKAKWEAARVERRLEEAETLAAQGKLDTEARSTIETGIALHTENIEKNTSDSANDDDIQTRADINAQLETTLKTHENILSQIGDEQSTIKAQIAPLLLKIKTETKTASEARIHAEEKLSSRTSAQTENAAQNKARVAERTLIDAKTTLESKVNLLDEKTKATAEAKIKAAESAFIEGKSKIESKDFPAAFIAFQNTERLSQEARLFIRAGTHLKLKLNIDIESEKSDDHPDDVSTSTKIKSDESEKIQNEDDHKNDNSGILNIGL